MIHPSFVENTYKHEHKCITMIEMIIRDHKFYDHSLPPKQI